ncbi:MAG TPA: hypothetical protein VK698_24785 [Kofleriaceae bacterium]|nr:hypothetical protein [Kofleriaceae bacterium]
MVRTATGAADPARLRAGRFGRRAAALGSAAVSSAPARPCFAASVSVAASLGIATEVGFGVAAPGRLASGAGSGEALAARGSSVGPGSSGGRAAAIGGGWPLGSIAGSAGLAGARGVADWFASRGAGLVAVGVGLEGAALVGLVAQALAGPARQVGVLAPRVPLAARGRGVIAREVDQVAQAGDLGLGQLARVADSQAVVVEAGERHALQLEHLVAERLGHAVDLARLALGQGDDQPVVAALAAQVVHLGRAGQGAVLQPDPAPHRLHVGRPHLAAELHVIGLLDVLLRRLQRGRQVAVVGQEQHALAVVVEPTDRLHRDREVVQVLHHGQAALVVRDRRDAPLRLVEHAVEQLLRVGRLAVDRDLIDRRIHRGAELGDRLAVHAHPPGGDQVLRLAASRHAGLRQIAL